MSQTDACFECLKRPWLLATLGPYIERTVTGRAASGARELLALSDAELIAKVAPDRASSLLGALEADNESELRDELAATGSWAVCRHAEDFPAGLRDLPDAPPALVCRGERALLPDLSRSRLVTVVGSRRATSYGREIARTLGGELASAGALVTSGLAFGIDASAHRAALDAGCPTVAVLGCGPDIAYPAAHRGLWRKITERGLVLSELSPGTTPWRWTFPARNRIMAALGRMTVVMEATERSGTLVTARFAAELGRPVGAVPGPITSRASAGPNALLSGGAHLVRCGADVLDALG